MATVKSLTNSCFDFKTVRHLGSMGNPAFHDLVCDTN